MSNIFKPAVRRALKLKIGVQGPSGSGKTRGALALAVGLARGGKVAVIDTENGSASYYADEFAFDTLNLRPPYTSDRYLKAIAAAAEAGYAVAVLDSMSHQWAGSGGILERKDAIDARGGNSYTNWGAFTKEHEQFKAGILNAPIHVIATMRSKQDYVVETNDKGKTAPRKVGLAPIQREGMEYEFGVVFEVQMDHRALVSKDRTKLFEGVLIDLLDPEVTKSLLGWLDSAALETAPEPEADPLPVQPEPAPTPAPRAEKHGRTSRPANVDGDGVIHKGAEVGDILFPFGKYKGTKLADIPTDYFEWALEKMDRLDDGLRAAIVAVLRDRKEANAKKEQAVAAQPLSEAPMMLDEEEDDLPF